MNSYTEKIRENFFILIIGIIYYFSFSGLNIGDSFFRSMENDYPLFYTTIYQKYPLWFGFEPAHLLNIPTLRLIQLLIAKVRLFPNPLILTQLINLFLSLCTLRLFYSILLRLNITKSASIATTLLFGFSYGFYANMNGEIHHFSIFLLAAVIWLLLRIENKESPDRYSIFLTCFCLSLLPLYHLETIIYSGIIIFYILFRETLRKKFIANPRIVIFGLIILPALLIIGSIVFHYLDTGEPQLNGYTSSLAKTFRLKSYQRLAVQAYGHFDMRSIYILLRSHLESFSIISRVSKVLKHYSGVFFYSKSPSAVISFLTVIAYLIIFSLTNVIAAILFVKNKNRIPGFIKFLILLLFAYLTGYGIFFSNVYLYSEFYITSVMLHCILFGYLLNKQFRFLYCALIALTIFSNIFFYIYPQKISAASINKAFKQIETETKDRSETAIFRVGFINFPYDISLNYKFKLYFDEHAYDSETKTQDLIDSINSEFSGGKKVYLIIPSFLAYENSKEINLESLLSIGIEKNSVITGNLIRLLDYLGQNYKSLIKKEFPYNFGTLGQLGNLALVELKK